MSVNVVFNGTTYAVPIVGETGWGSQVTGLLQDLGTNALPVTGGTVTGAVTFTSGATIQTGGTFTGTFAGAHTYSGSVAHTGGITFGNVAAATVTDLTKHISLYATTFGINITGSQLNLTVPAGNNVSINGGATSVAKFSTTTGLTMQANMDITLARDPTTALQASTKQYVDTKAPIANPTLTGTTTANAIKITAAPVETSVAMPASNIDLSTGTLFTKTISTNTTLTVSNVAASGSVSSFILVLTNGGSATVTWWTGVKWSGATTPTLTAAGVDSLGFYTIDGGTTWHGFLLAKDLR